MGKFLHYGWQWQGSAALLHNTSFAFTEKDICVSELYIYYFWHPLRY